MLKELQTLDEQATMPHTIEIAFLFLDLTTCTRCVGTDENLTTALDEVQHILSLTNTAVQLEKILIATEAEAQAHQFVSSPTIRVNGRDIALETKESRCDSCTDLCGCEAGTDCRVWLYRGEEHTEAPVGMIIEAILREVFSSQSATTVSDEVVKDVPDNLKRFFAGTDEATNGMAEISACCSAEKQTSCCDSSAKASCCDATNQTGSCGCQ